MSAQFGLATEDALYRFVTNIYYVLNDKIITAGPFVDLTKAFDVVGHTILFDKLHQILIKGIAIEWFTTYLNHRTQRTYIDGYLSSEVFIKIGIPQGSVLGPILF